jgi:hypothetical protein
MAQCLSLEISPDQIIKPILIGEMDQNDQNTGYLFRFWPFWSTLKWTQKIFSKAHKWAGCMAQCPHPQMDPKCTQSCKWAEHMAQCLS